MAKPNKGNKRKPDLTVVTNPAEAAAIAEANQPVTGTAETVSESVPPQPAPTTNGNGGDDNFIARVDEWSKRAHDVMEHFAEFSIEVLGLVLRTRNATYAKHLQNAMPKGMRKRAFAVWLRTYSPINLTKEDDKTGNFLECSLLKPGDKFFHDFDIEAAKAHPFGEEKEEVKALDPSNWDQGKELANKIASLAKSILGEGKRQLGISVTDAKRKLNSLAGDYHALLEGKRVGPLSDATQILVKRAKEYNPETPKPAVKAA